MDSRHKIIVVLVILVAIFLVIFTNNQRFEEEVPEPVSSRAQNSPAVDEQASSDSPDPDRSFVPKSAIDTT
ncbi:MAG: hypothetical protein PVH46_04835, partial [Granulosicoccaceae bacterium]